MDNTILISILIATNITGIIILVAKTLKSKRIVEENARLRDVNCIVVNRNRSICEHNSVLADKLGLKNKMTPISHLEK